MKGKIAGIFLSLCLVLPISATFLFLHLQMKQVKREVKCKMIAGIDKKELVLLKFSESESQTSLNWKHSKEFEYKGEMYDVVEKKIHGDSIFYWCWWDHEETKLNKKLKSLVADSLGQNPQRKDKQEKLADFFKKLFYEYQQSNFNTNLTLEQAKFSCTEKLNSFYPYPSVPPPQRA